MSFTILLVGLPTATTTFTTHEPRAAVVHVEQAHEGAVGEPHAA
jgi:hypothetical protein